MDVLVRLSHRLNGQDADVEILGALSTELGQHPLGDHRVGADRQVRSMLLDGGGRQDGDHSFGVYAVELGRTVVGPIEAAGHVVSFGA